MLGLLRKHATYANVTATLALTAALGGGAYAAIGADGVLNGCFKKHGGALRLVNAGAKCKSSEKSIAWNQQGPGGANGAQGAQGSAGSPGQNGSAGTNGTNGTNGTPGAPGSTVKAKASGSGSSGAENTPVTIPLTGASWTQTAGNPEQIDATFSWQPPAAS